MPIRLAGGALVNPSFCRKAVIFRAESALLAGTGVPGQVVKSPSAGDEIFKQFSVRTNRRVLAALPARDSRLVNAELLSELLLSESEVQRTLSVRPGLCSHGD
jgi:hypothetical protein